MGRSSSKTRASTMVLNLFEVHISAAIVAAILRTILSIKEKNQQQGSIISFYALPHKKTN
jgi:hypothetical protein